MCFCVNTYIFGITAKYAVRAGPECRRLWIYW